MLTDDGGKYWPACSGEFVVVLAVSVAVKSLWHFL